MSAISLYMTDNIFEKFNFGGKIFYSLTLNILWIPLFWIQKNPHILLKILLNSILYWVIQKRHQIILKPIRNRLFIKGTVLNHCSYTLSNDYHVGTQYGVWKYKSQAGWAVEVWWNAANEHFKKSDCEHLCCLFCCDHRLNVMEYTF